MVDQENSKRRLTTDDYTVGWICPLEVEQIAALEMLDEDHERLPQASTDHNVYNLGSIAGHNVVIAGLHQAGNNPAATVVAQMRMTFRNLRFGLLVGIGGGVPVKTDNGMIRLGDVIVSKPTGGHSGAVQYDHGKVRDGEFQRTGALAPPPTVLLNAAQDLAAKRARSRKDPVEENIKRIDTSIRGLRRYKHPGTASDRLYRADYIHCKPSLPCDECGCDPSKLIQRPSEDDDDEAYIVVHRGTIASGEMVIKDAMIRDQLAGEYGFLCFEMEAAGALDDFPCLVIRGISDYCDSHKNDHWHGYAAATAAAYSRQLFFHMPVSGVQRYISETTEKNIKRINSLQEGQNRQKILEWLSPSNFPAQQQDIISRRQEGTAQWFLDSAEFQRWLQTPNGVLFCPGIPGAGKTMMAAVAIDHLNRTVQSDEIGIAYLFCSYKTQMDQSATSLIAAILKQLLQARPSVAEPLQQLHNQHAKHMTRPLLDQILSVLREVLLNYSIVYVITDALDECPNEARHQFLDKLRELPVRSGRDIRLMATSRFIPEIVNSFRETPLLEVQASEEDVKRFVAGQIQQLPRCVRQSPSLQELVKEKIAEAVDGMFLLARLNTDSLRDKRTVKDVKSTLANLKKGSAALNSAYDDALHRIESQLGGDYGLAKKVLSWITLAKRPLTTAEICCALAVEPQDTELDLEGIPNAEDLLSVCAGLVVIDENSGDIIRLVHYTTQEYFERNINRWNCDAQLHIASTCLTYLSFDVFKGGSSETANHFERKLKQNQFLRYAANYWGEHAAKTEDEVCELACSLLLDSKLLSCASQVLYGYGRSGQTGLHVAARFELPSISRTYLSKLGTEAASVVNMEDRSLHTPIYLAAYYGRYEMVKLLLEAGADVGLDRSYPAIYAAAPRGHQAIVELLLSAGADVTSRDLWRTKQGLYAASEGGHEGVVRVFLEEGADPKVNARNFNALRAASQGGYETIVKVLLEAEAEVNVEEKNSDARTALTAAVSQGYEAIVNLLLDAGADIDAGVNGSALCTAASHGYEAMVKLLLNRGANVHKSWNRYKESALYGASRGGYEAIVKLLLEAGADVNAQSGQYHSALCAASRAGHKEVVKILLRAGADVNAEGPDYSDHALCAAAQGGFEGVVQLLLHAGAVVDAQDKMDGRYALYEASSRGYEAIVKLLLDAGAKTHMWDRIHGDAPLCVASLGGFEGIVKLLLDAGADVNATSESGDSAFAGAAEGGNEAVVKMLLDAGANINDTGGHALSSASTKGHLAIVKLLLSLGVSVKSSNGHFALKVASYEGHEGVVKLLLAAGPHIDSVNHAMRQASLKGRKTIVKLLVDAGAVTCSEDDDSLDNDSDDYDSDV